VNPGELEEGESETGEIVEPGDGEMTEFDMS